MTAPDGQIRSLLAANLRQARMRRGLSLSELARLSRIGKATLSQLEAGSGNPTIETVFSLSRALEMPISDLLESASSDPVTVVRGAEAETLSGAGVDLRPLQRIETSGLIVEVYDQRFRADRRQESLGHAGREHTMPQTGRLRVEVDGRRVDLGPGDYIAFDATLAHAYTPLDGEPVRSVLLLHYRPESGEHSPVPH